MDEVKAETPPVVADADEFGLTDEDFAPDPPTDEEPETPDDETPSPEPSDPAASPTEPVSATPPDATVKPETQAPDAPVLPSQQVAPEPQSKPWVPRVYGGDLPIPGATINDKGEVLVPAAQLQRFLANPDVIRDREVHSRREIERLTKEADPSRNEAVIRADQLTRTILKHYDDGTLPEFLDNFAQAYPILAAEAKAKALELRLEEKEARVSQIDQDAQYRQLEPIDRQSLERTIQEQITGPDYEGFDTKSFEAALWEQRDSLFRAPTEQERQEWGLHPEQRRIIDPKVWSREVSRFQFFAKQLRDAKAATAIQQKNKAALAPTPVAAPAPTTRTSASPPVERAKPKTKEEWEGNLAKFVADPSPLL
jgi:hypothetical protein